MCTYIRGRRVPVALPENLKYASKGRSIHGGTFALSCSELNPWLHSRFQVVMTCWSEPEPSLEKQVPRQSDRRCQTVLDRVF